MDKNEAAAKWIDAALALAKIEPCRAANSDTEELCGHCDSVTESLFSELGSIDNVAASVGVDQMDIEMLMLACDESFEVLETVHSLVMGYFAARSDSEMTFGE